MPTLHELFDAATDGMPPLPDLAPSARRIVRRRQLATRTTAAVLSSALVIGAGTFALSAHLGTAHDAASGPPQPYSNRYVLDTLRSLWPNKDQQLSLEQGGNGIVISQDGRQVGLAFFWAFADVAKFPDQLSCYPQDAGCLQATTADGDKVLAEHGELSEAQIQLTTPPSLSASLGQSAAAATAPASMPANSPKILAPSAQNRGYRLHGMYLGQLNITASSPSALLTDQQLLSLVESPAYEQLIQSAADSSSLAWFGTQPAGIPSNTTTNAPFPSDSGN